MFLYLIVIVSYSLVNTGGEMSRSRRDRRVPLRFVDEEDGPEETGGVSSSQAQEVTQFVCTGYVFPALLQKCFFNS